MALMPNRASGAADSLGTCEQEVLDAAWNIWKPFRKDEMGKEDVCGRRGWQGEGMTQKYLSKTMWCDDTLTRDQESETKARESKWIKEIFIGGIPQGNHEAPKAPLGDIEQEVHIDKGLIDVCTSWVPFSPWSWAVSFT
jgi:hypothetical protein